MHPGDCSTWPKNAGWPAIASDRMARLTPPCKTRSAVSQFASSRPKFSEAGSFAR